MKELQVKLKTWKSVMENTGKITVSCINLDLLNKSGKDPSGVCQTGVGNNAIFCDGCICWIHKKYSLHPNPHLRCARCLGTAQPNDVRTVKEMKVDDEKLEFCYLWER